MPVSVPLRGFVLARDQFRCVYCHTTQENSGQPLQIDHIIPVAAGGATQAENLCACCATCNIQKWVKTQATDPLTRELTPLFHPLHQLWQDHFAWEQEGVMVMGLTPCGRATVEALKMNNPVIMRARRRWIEVGWHPPT